MLSSSRYLEQYGEMETADLWFSKLRSALSHLSKSRCAAFAAACSERLFPNYIRFSLEERWGDPEVLRRALDDVWRVARGGNVVRDRLESLFDACVAVTPDTEDFTSPRVSPALDAAGAIQSAVRCCIDGEPRAAAVAGALARDTVYMYLDTSLAGGESPVLNIEVHPLFVAELARQEEDLQLLSASDIPDQAIADSLYTRSLGRSPIP